MSDRICCGRCGLVLVNGRGGCHGAQHGNIGCALNKGYGDAPPVMMGEAAGAPGWGDIPNPNPNPDPVGWPAHYNQGEIECIDAMRAAFGQEAVENYCIVNAFKYIWRHREKNNVQDLKKAIWYLRFATGDDPRKDGRG